MFIEALFYGTIMVAIVTLGLSILKWNYLKTCKDIATHYYKEDKSMSYPVFDVNVNSSLLWNGIITLLIVLSGLIYDLTLNARQDNVARENKELTIEVAQQREALETCKLDAEKALLIRLKTKTETE